MVCAVLHRHCTLCARLGDSSLYASECTHYSIDPTRLSWDWIECSIIRYPLECSITRYPLLSSHTLASHTLYSIRHLLTRYRGVVWSEKDQVMGRAHTVECLPAHDGSDIICTISYIASCMPRAV